MGYLTLYWAVCVDIKCPVCHKNVPPDSVEIHLVMCLTKPHIVYNGKLSHVMLMCYLLVTCYLRQ